VNRPPADLRSSARARSDRLIRPRRVGPMAAVAAGEVWSPRSMAPSSRSACQSTSGRPGGRARSA